MKKADLNQLRSQTLEQLLKLKGDEEKQLLTLKMNQTTGKLKNPRQIFHQRKTLAVINTLIREKQLSK
jgi:ribosomal protein L29